jgi:hypothetical protein
MPVLFYWCRGEHSLVSDYLVFCSARPELIGVKDLSLAQRRSP